MLMALFIAVQIQIMVCLPLLLELFGLVVLRLIMVLVVRLVLKVLLIQMLVTVLVESAHYMVPQKQ